MVDDVLLTPVVAVPKGWDEWLNKGQEDALDLSPGINQNFDKAAVQIQESAENTK